jgi:hypothetical protein
VISDKGARSAGDEKFAKWLIRQERSGPDSISFFLYLTIIGSTSATETTWFVTKKKMADLFHESCTLAAR